MSRAKQRPCGWRRRGTRSSTRDRSIRSMKRWPKTWQTGRAPGNARTNARCSHTFARTDSVSVLAFRVKQLTAAGVDDADIHAACPPSVVSRREVDALARWGTLAKALRPRFDSGEIPLGLLWAVLQLPEPEQEAGAERLLTAGVKTSRQAARRATVERTKADPWARPMTPKMAERIASDLFEMAKPSRAHEVGPPRGGCSTMPNSIKSLRNYRYIG